MRRVEQQVDRLRLPCRTERVLAVHHSVLRVYVFYQYQQDL